MTRVTVSFLENDACEVVRGRAKSKRGVPKQISCWCPPDETKFQLPNFFQISRSPHSTADTSITTDFLHVQVRFVDVGALI
jgi:hypothetical protein